MDIQKIKDNCRTALIGAISIKRPAGSHTEGQFAAAIAMGGATLIDQAGNLHFDMRKQGGGMSRTMFTAHTDTVHNSRCEGLNPYKLVVENGVEKALADGDVLGADDGAGCAILMAMMAAKVPGYYIFFREEECGGNGSDKLAKDYQGLLKEFDRAIAFDRKGYGDIITHQMTGRCCSDEFAQALSDRLNYADETFMYSPDDGGSFTDTANLVYDIPECTNVSVGYFAQHTVKEEQNITFLQQLAAACCQIDWETLPVVRKAEPEKFGGAADFHSFARGYGLSRWDDDEAEFSINDEIKLDLQVAVEWALDRDYHDLVNRLEGLNVGTSVAELAKVPESYLEKWLLRTQGASSSLIIAAAIAADLKKLSEKEGV